MFLEGICYWLLIKNNVYHSSSFFHSSNQFVGTLYNIKDGFTSYIDLREVNSDMNRENARLREQIYHRARPVIIQSELDSAKVPEKIVPYKFIAARIINNSTSLSHNHFTINKGSKDGIKPGMGIIGPEGVVGKVRSVSGRFATAYSLLNTNMLISSSIKSSNEPLRFLLRLSTAFWLRQVEETYFGIVSGKSR